MTRIVFLHIIFKYVSHLSELTPARLRYFFQLCNLNSGFRETLMLYPGRTKLDLSSSWISYQGFQVVSNLVSLRKLNLSMTSVSNTGLQLLFANLNLLEVLILDTTNISDAGLCNIGNLTSLKYLYLNFTNVSSVGLQYLSKLTSLQNLGLSKTKIDNDGLRHLGGLTSLRVLTIDFNNNISFAGLQHLVHLPNLDADAFAATHRIEGYQTFVKQLRENQEKQKAQKNAESSET